MGGLPRHRSRSPALGWCPSSRFCTYRTSRCSRGPSSLLFVHDAVLLASSGQDIQNVLWEGGAPGLGARSRVAAPPHQREPAGTPPLGRTRKRWSDFVTWLAWKCLGILPEGLDECLRRGRSLLRLWIRWKKMDNKKK